MSGRTERPRLKRRFNGPIAAWVYKTAKRNLWRVYPLMDLDDCVAVARLVFWQVDTKYPGVRIKHFASLFRISYINRLHTLAGQRHKYLGVAATRLTKRGRILYFVEAPDKATEQAELNDLVRSAPEPVRKLVRVLIPPREYNDIGRRLREVPRRHSRESWNTYFCRIAGANPAEINLVDMVLKAFGAENQKDLYLEN